MQAKIIRETVIKTAAASPDMAPKAKAAMLAEASRLRNPDKAGHGIGQLREAGDEARAQAAIHADRSERYELGETLLQVAIVLMSIALIARSWAIVIGSAALAAGGVLIAVLTVAGIL